MVADPRPLAVDPPPLLISARGMVDRYYVTSLTEGHISAFCLPAWSLTTSECLAACPAVNGVDRRSESRTWPQPPDAIRNRLGGVLWILSNISNRAHMRL